MAGSLKAFTYESDEGVLYGVRRDESGGEATFGGASLFASFVAGRPNIATGIKCRYINTVLSTDPNIKKRFEVGRPSVFNSINAGGQIIEAAGGLVAGGTYLVTSKVGEVCRFLTAADTGQIDGDNP